MRAPFLRIVMGFVRFIDQDRIMNRTNGSIDIELQFNDNQIKKGTIY